MTGDWARQDIFTGIFDKVIISVLSKEDPHIQAPLCASVKLNWEWRFHFPSRWPQPLVFFSPGHRWDHPVLVWLDRQKRIQSWLLLWCCCSGVLFQSRHWTKPWTTKLSKDQTEQNARAKTGLLLLAAPPWEQEHEPRRRWVSLRITASCRHPNSLSDLIYQSDTYIQHIQI